MEEVFPHQSECECGQCCEECGMPARVDQDEYSIVQCQRCYDQDEEDEK